MDPLDDRVDTPTPGLRFRVNQESESERGVVEKLPLGHGHSDTVYILYFIKCTAWHLVLWGRVRTMRSVRHPPFITQQ
ncbi:hypothetical protein GCM10022198_18470 [Klugiella xanthotipulae]